MIRTLFFTTNVSEYKIVSGIIMTERKIYGVSTPKRYEYVREHLEILYRSVSSII